MRKRIICVLSTFLLISSTAASGAVKEGSFSVSPLIGGYLYDGGQHVDGSLSLVLGARAGYNLTKNIGVEALYDYAIRRDTSAGPFREIAINRYGGDALYHFFPDSTLVPYLAAGYSGINFSSNYQDKTHGAFDYGAGAKYFLTDNFALRGDVRHILYLLDSRTNSNVELMVGTYLQFGCATPPVKAVAAEPAPVQVPEPVKVEAKAATVPPPVPSDRLSITPDSIAKEQTATPTLTSPTPAIVVVPPKSDDAVLCSRPIIKVTFATNKYGIKSQHHDELKKLAELLKQFPESKGVIEGHTDNVGSKAYNMKLSRKRADSARRYLINNFGIAAERISTKGYGITKPVADNNTKEGRRQNRRIEANFNCSDK